MDFHLKQWRNHQHQHESEHQQKSAKIPNLLEDQPSSVLPLFVPEPDTKISSNLSAASPRMGSYFSLAQWQELELQALIYRYIMAGAAVPPQLLLPIKKSLHLQSPPLFLHNYQQSALMQTGYWGRSGMDPEPGRCRRTDGKKWRCSKDVVPGRRYCERHMNRGRNRSRKPVEMPTSNGPSFGLSGLSPSADLLHLNKSASDSKTENKGFFKPQNDGHILRHFMDERSIQETDNATCLSISLPGNSSSGISLKLSTGNSLEQAQQQLNWPAGWESFPITSTGGSLAEALRSSGSDSSPTSVLHQLPRGSVSETSFRQQLNLLVLPN